MSVFNPAQYKKTTLKVFNDCFLPNGGIVAAPSHTENYPKDAKNYFYIWPGRDAGFVLAAMSLVGIDRYDLFLRWLWDRAECFHESVHHLHSGLIYRSYYPNGLLREHTFQPDQSATLIWSINFKNTHYQKNPSELELNVIRKLADGIASVWSDTSFSIEAEDIWEETKIPENSGVFIYSLAACAYAMKISSKLINNKKYDEMHEEMLHTLKYYLNKYHEIPNKIINDKAVTTADSSLLGLIWPFNVLSDDKISEKILSAIFSLENNNEFYRYTEDKYQGSDGFHKKNHQAGTWPLIGFWTAVALKKLGYSQKSKDIFNHTMSKYSKDYFIPEQEFGDRNWIGVKPLLWAQTMPLFYLCDEESNHI